MPDTPSITIVKNFQYRGVSEDWSNKYHFEGTTPSTEAGWKALADALIAAERPVVPPSVTFVAAYGYEAGKEAAVARIDYREPPNSPPLAGTYSIGSDRQAPGDVAVWVRWKTAARTSKGKPIYLRKYFHAPAVNGTDAVASAQKTALTTYAGKMIDGTLPGGFKICRPQGGVGLVAKVPSFVTTRTLKRRGADPS